MGEIVASEEQDPHKNGALALSPGKKERGEEEEGNTNYPILRNDGKELAMDSKYRQL